MTYLNTYLNRILAIELRRSGVLRVAFLLAVPTIGVMLVPSSRSVFDGLWMQLAVTVRSLMQLALPLAVGGGAWLGMQEHRHHLGELLDSTPKSRAQRVFPRAFSLAGLAAASYLIAVAVGLPAVLGTASYFPAAVLPITAVGVLSLVAAGLLGMAAGRAVPRLIIVPVLVLVTAGLAGILPTIVHDEQSFGTGPDRYSSTLWLSPIWTFGAQDFTTLTSRVSLLQVVLTGSLAITGLLLTFVRRRFVLPALVPAGAGVALAMILLPASGGAALATDAGAVVLHCTDHGPQVCVTQVHAFELDQVAAAAQPVLTGLAQIPGAPKRATEIQTLDGDLNQNLLAKGRSGTIYFGDPNTTYLTNGKFGAKAFQQALVDGAFTPPCDADGVLEGGTNVVGAWLAGATSMLDPDPEGDGNYGTRGITLWSGEDVAQFNRAITGLEALPPARQKAMVARAWKGVQACRPGAMKQILALGNL